MQYLIYTLFWLEVDRFLRVFVSFMQYGFMSLQLPFGSVMSRFIRPAKIRTENLSVHVVPPLNFLVANTSSGKDLIGDVASNK